jgi:hypothetical protein
MTAALNVPIDDNAIAKLETLERTLANSDGISSEELRLFCVALVADVLLELRESAEQRAIVRSFVNALTRTH